MTLGAGSKEASRVSSARRTLTRRHRGQHLVSNIKHKYTPRSAQSGNSIPPSTLPAAHRQRSRPSRSPAVLPQRAAASSSCRPCAVSSCGTIYPARVACQRSPPRSRDDAVYTAGRLNWRVPALDKTQKKSGNSRKERALRAEPAQQRDVDEQRSREGGGGGVSFPSRSPRRHPVCWLGFVTLGSAGGYDFPTSIHLHGFPRSNGRLPHTALGKESSSGLLLIRQFREMLISGTDLSSGLNIVFEVSGYMVLFVYECPTPIICDGIEYATPECREIHQSDRSQIATLMTEDGTTSTEDIVDI